MAAWSCCFDLTESDFVNQWISKGVAIGRLQQGRKSLLEVLELRFPGALPKEAVLLIQRQESLELLDEWFKAALRASTFEQFLDVLKR